MATKPKARAQGRAPDSYGVQRDVLELIGSAINVAYYEWSPGSDDAFHFSPALLNLFGYDPAIRMGRSFWESIHNDDQPAYHTARIAYLEGSSDRAEFTYRARMASGEYRWLRDQTTVERDAAGRVTRLVGALSDITEARQRDLDLQAANRALADRDAENRALIARQAASIEVLKTISASPDDPQPVFELIARRARELCKAARASVTEYDGTRLHMRARDGYDPATAEFGDLSWPQAPTVDSVHGRVTLSGGIVHVRDVSSDSAYGERSREVKDRLGSRSLLGVPLLREGQMVGSIVLDRAETGGFDASEVAVVEAFAEQAVIAIASAGTLRELRARTAQLATRNSEYSERIEQQAATIDVLKVMSASPGDARPVFELIVDRARAFCEADGATVALLDGDMLHLQAHTITGPAAEYYEAQFPRPVSTASMFGRAILARDAVQMPDLSTDLEHFTRTRAAGAGVRSIIAVPLLRAGTPIGAIALSRRVPGEFSATQMELLRTFAEQAVIAVSSAETYRELQARTAALAERNSEYGERIEHQSATIDVLKEMSASPGDAQPVFDLIVRRARDLCNAAAAVLFEYDGQLVYLRSDYGIESFSAPSAIDAYRRLFPMAPTRAAISCRAILDRQIMHIRDMRDEPGVLGGVRDLGHRSNLAIPLLRDGASIGAMAMASWETGGFTDSQVELLKTFAEQAVIAIGSAETYRELQARTAELTDALETQSATADVLKAISRAAYDLDTVLTMLITTALRLCNSAHGQIWRRDGETYRYVASLGNVPAYREIEEHTEIRAGRGTLVGRVAMEGRTVQIADAWNDPDYADKAAARMGQARSMLGVPLLRDGEMIGAFALARKDLVPYTAREVELVTTFADQAVIAIENVRLFDEVQARTAALARSVAELQALEEVLRAVNSSLDLETVLATIISRAVQLSQADEGTIYEFDDVQQVFVPKAAFGMSSERVEALRERKVRVGEAHLGRAAVLRAPVHIDDVQQDTTLVDVGWLLQGIHAVLAVPLLRDDKVIGGLVIRRRTAGGFAPTIPTLLQTFAGQSVLAIENARLFQEARRARTEAEATLTDLRRAQDRLVQSEKMASLGQLTAGIAHEIKNPLNFVNNFSDLSVDLLDELHDAVAPDKLAIAADLRAEIDELTTTLKSNLEKINQHGRRADSIVKNMLLHSRSGPSEHRAIDLNSTVEEALNLAYHGARAETPGFNITLEKELDPAAGTVDLFPQEFTRVMLNLIANGFYAAHRRAEETTDKAFEPTLRLTTRDLGEHVEIRVRDNGTGISDTVRDKIFEPFFTTKPAGAGTGLGLSLSYDIVVKQHGGQLAVDSQIGAFTEFTITLPRLMTTTEGGTQ